MAVGEVLSGVGALADVRGEAAEFVCVLVVVGLVCVEIALVLAEDLFYLLGV